MSYTPPNPNGQATMANSAPVTIASDQPEVPVKAGTNLNTSALALEAGNLASIKAKTDNIPSQGQALAAASLPVVLPAAQITTLTPPAAITNFANETGGNLASIKTNTDKIPALGQATMTASTPVVISSNQTNVPVTANDVTATGNITTQNLAPTGSATAGSALLSGALNGQTTLSVQVTGTYTGALSLQGTVDGTNWITVGGTVFININNGVYSATIASGVVGIFQADCSGFSQVRVTGLAAMTGTAVVTMRASSGSGLVALDAALPAGSNVIGGVTVASGGIASGALAAGSIAAGAAVAGAFVDGSNATLGTTSGAAVITDVAGTIQQYLRGLIKLAITAGSFLVRASVASGGVASGAIASGAVASGAVATGAIASGAVASGAIASGAYAAGSMSSVGVGLTESAAVGTVLTNVGGTSITAPKTATHNGDAVGWVGDTLGRQIVMPYTNPENIKQGATSDITNTTATTIIAGTASNYLYVTSILVTNSHATVSTFVNITEETSGTVLASGYALAAGGGFSLTFPSPMRLPTIAKAIQATCVTTGANVRASAVGFIATI